MDFSLISAILNWAIFLK